MRFILITNGSYGDIYPFIWIGRLLKQQGSEVIFLTNPYFESVLSKEPFEFSPIGTIEDYEIAITPEEVTGNILKNFKASKNLVKKVLECLFVNNINDVFDRVADFKTDNTIIINHFSLFGAKLASEKFLIPNININLSTHWIRNFRKATGLLSFIQNKSDKFCYRFIDKKILSKPLNQIRKKMNLKTPKKNYKDWMFEGINLNLFPDWFVDFKLPENINANYVGFPGNLNDDAILPKEIISFLERNEKPILFTSGTPVKGFKIFFEEALHTLKRIDKPGIFLTKFKENLPENLPENVLYIDFAPLELLLPRCAVLVHPGGIGTCSQGLKAGIPQVICSLTFEQKENARILKKLGIARQFKGNKITSELMFTNLTDLMYNEDVKNKCNEIKNKLENELPSQNFLNFLDNISLKRGSFYIMVEKLIERMVLYFRNDVRRINHSLKVHAYAKLISTMEEVKLREREVIEASAILHDIGIKEAERKYNSTAGKYQEIEGPSIARKMLLECGVEQAVIDRVCFLVGNHHSYQKIDGLDFQILIEADFLVNIHEDEMERNSILSIEEKYIKTKSGKKLIKNMYINE